MLVRQYKIKLCFVAFLIYYSVPQSIHTLAMEGFLIFLHLRADNQVFAHGDTKFNNIYKVFYFIVRASIKKKDPRSRFST